MTIVQARCEGFDPHSDIRAYSLLNDPEKYVGNAALWQQLLKKFPYASRSFYDAVSMHMRALKSHLGVCAAGATGRLRCQRPRRKCRRPPPPPQRCQPKANRRHRPWPLPLQVCFHPQQALPSRHLSRPAAPHLPLIEGWRMQRKRLRRA